MGTYQNHKLSLVRFCKGLAGQLGWAKAPVFVDLDAHAEMDTLPKTDFIGLSSFAIQFDEKMVSVFANIVCGVWEDPDLMRLTEMMDLVTEKLVPTSQIPVFSPEGGPNTPVSWMVVANDTSIPPTDNTSQRAIQMVTIRCQSGSSGS